MTLTKELLNDLVMRQRKGWRIRPDEFEFLLEVARQTLERLERNQAGGAKPADPDLFPSHAPAKSHPYPWNTRTP